MIILVKFNDFEYLLNIWKILQLRIKRNKCKLKETNVSKILKFDGYSARCTFVPVDIYTSQHIVDLSCELDFFAPTFSLITFSLITF